MTLKGLVVLGTTQQAEHNAAKWAQYRTHDPKAKLLLAALIAHQHEHTPLTLDSVKEQSLLPRPQISKTLRALIHAGVLRLERGGVRIAIP